MKRAMVVLVCMFAATGCQIISADPPYAGPLWGDACLADKGEHVISGCTHSSDGTGDPGWGSPTELGLCAPPGAATLASMPDDLRRSGYTGSCRPFCDVTPDGSAYTCPAGGVPTYEIHSIATSAPLCYCADADVDAAGTLAL